MSPYKNNWYSKEKSGWHEFTINRIDDNAYTWIKYYNNIVKWIEEQVDGAEKHSRWVINPEHAVFRFRYERDYLKFILRWS